MNERVKRLKRGTRIAAGIAGFLISVAAAWFFAGFLGDGEYTGEAGEGGTGYKTVPINVSYPSGELTPTNPVEITAEVENVNDVDLEFTHLSFTASSSAPGCNASWLKVDATSDTGEHTAYWNNILAGGTASPALKYPKETLDRELGNSMSYAGLGVFRIKIVDSGTDQTACEGAPVTVHAHLTE